MIVAVRASRAGLRAGATRGLIVSQWGTRTETVLIVSLLLDGAKHVGRTFGTKVRKALVVVFLLEWT